MILDADQVRGLYRRIAPFYDLSLIPFRALGDRRNRLLAVRSLRLQAGDTVVDLGCGTGINIPLLLEAVGPSGRVIGVDLSEEMLSNACERTTSIWSSQTCGNGIRRLVWMLLWRRSPSR